MEGLKYSKSHEWIRAEGDFAYIGISDYAQHNLGSIVFVDLPEIDDSFDQGEEFGAIESVKAASDLVMPVSGTVVAVNENLLDDPESINKDCYETWIIKIEMSDSDELTDLLNKEDYEKTIE